jgi:hypothetical protein
MTETRKTAVFAAAALLLAALAWTNRPRLVPPAVFADRGEAFFPELANPDLATSLEVVEFDETLSIARPFKVLNRDGRWTIPSHYGYPADGRERLSTIAAAVIALRKDDVASDNAVDHERLGVLDPLDETLPSLRGRGTRITVRGRNDSLLADIIAGNPVEGRPRFRYVRVPDAKRTYVADVGDLTFSTRFEDWIERNLLQVNRDDIDQIVIRNYSANPTTGAVDEREMLILRRKSPDAWTLDGAKPGEAVDPFAMNLLVTRLVELAIMDVRPKPPTVSATLGRAEGARMTAADVSELASRGFYFTSDNRLVSNQGEVLVHTATGVFYVLRFGEVARRAESGANRYLFISAGFDGNAGSLTDATRGRLDLLRTRFAPWYYVVSDDSVRQIRISRAELLGHAGAAASRR